MPAGEDCGWGECSPPLQLRRDAPLELYGRSGALYADGHPVGLKGFNWFGSEGELRVLAGLKERAAGELMEFAVQHRFNAMRLLFNWEDWAADQPIPSDSFSPTLNPGLVNATYRGMLLHFVQLAAEHGLLVLLACHRIRRSYGDSGIHAEWPGSWDGLWYDADFSEEQISRMWVEVADVFCAEPNLFGVDVMNEPHAAAWGSGGGRDWAAAASRLGNALLGVCGRWLVLVQGTADPGMWGENLSGVREHPVALRNRSKLVYSPHTYGPSLFKAIPEYEPEQYTSWDFPANMPQGWEWLWGYVTVEQGTPLLLGEAGGDAVCCDGRDEQWHRALVSYLGRKRASLFYFCLNPDSDDTGGLLELDWRSPVELKLSILAAVPSTRVLPLRKPPLPPTPLSPSPSLGPPRARGPPLKPSSPVVSPPPHPQPAAPVSPPAVKGHPLLPAPQSPALPYEGKASAGLVPLDMRTQSPWIPDSRLAPPMVREADADTHPVPHLEPGSPAADVPAATRLSEQSRRGPTSTVGPDHGLGAAAGEIGRAPMKASSPPLRTQADFLLSAVWEHRPGAWIGGAAAAAGCTCATLLWVCLRVLLPYSSERAKGRRQLRDVERSLRRAASRCRMVAWELAESEVDVVSAAGFPSSLRENCLSDEELPAASRCARSTRPKHCRLAQLDVLPLD